ncbi:MAG: SNF2-related protein [Thermoplasmatota archaeon]
MPARTMHDLHAISTHVEAATESAEGALARAPVRLQGAWESGPASGGLFVWAERPQPASADPPRRKGPRWAEPADVADALSRMGFPAVPFIEATSRKMWIPAPTSPEPGPRAPVDAGGAEAVRGVLIPARDCVRFLPILPRTAHRGEPGTPASDSMVFWGHIGRLALEMVARQRFVPAIATEGATREASLQGVWQPIWTDARDAERIALLAEAAPGAALAFASDVAPRAFLERAVASLLDAAVRSAAAEAFLGTEVGRLEQRAGEAVGTALGGQWITSLVGRDATFAADAVEGSRRKFARSVSQWTASLAPPSTFRTALRLEPPIAVEDAVIALPAPDAPWRLTYHLQSIEDPTLLVAAGRVWSEGADAAEFRARGMRAPEEDLLRDLGRASKIFPPIAESLAEAAPSGTVLAPPEVEPFFAAAAPRLAEAGFAVLLPGTRPLEKALVAKVVADVAKMDADAPVRFGLDAILDFRVEVALAGEPLTPQELDALASQKVALVRVRGEWVTLRPGDLDAARRLWQRRKSLSLRDVLEARARGTLEGVAVEVAAAKGTWLATLLGMDGGEPGGPDGLGRAGPAGLETPKGLRATLRPYQGRGIAWLRAMREMGLGCCLADDMGLGKTLQVIGARLAAREAESAIGPTLVVAPASVVGNWQREVARFAPELRVLVHHGSERATPRAFRSGVKNYDIVVTTYGVLVRDETTLGRVAWDTVVLDEAQNVKNHETRAWRAARQLRAAHRIAMTGTPVENRLAELWSIFEFLNPGYLGTRDRFEEEIAVPVERFGDERAAARARGLVQPFLLRRLKTDPNVIKDLPPKMEQKVLVNLTREQGTLYQAVVKDSLDKIEKADGIRRRALILQTMTRLKQLCNHPAHLLADGSPLPRRSGKLERLVEMLEEALEEGDKALIFTQFREMGTLMEPYLRERFGEIPFLHGGIARKERDAMVERFQSPDGPRVFLLSLRAGGVGLNLTSANRVFHFDRWWNPAVEDQATDRAFRIGQTRTVQVHKFVCVGTLEERIDVVLDEKRGLADKIVGSGESWITEMSNAQIRDLIALRPEAVSEA